MMAAPKSVGPLVTTIGYRADDGFLGSFEFDNLQVDVASSILRCLDPSKPASVRLILPPQHFLDVVNRGRSTAAPPDKPLYVSGPSSLVFDWPASLRIPYRLDALLQALSDLDVTLMPDGQTTVTGDTDWMTFIEYPLGLRLGPTDRTLRTYNPTTPSTELNTSVTTPLRTKAGLWHLRFIHRAAPVSPSTWQTINESAKDAPPLTLRAVQNPVQAISPALSAQAYDPTPGATGIDQSGRYIVIAPPDGRQEICDYSHNADPDLVKATDYVLTPQGIIADINWTLREPPAAHNDPPLDGLSMRTFLGVDSEFKESVACTAAPTGHWISYVKPVTRQDDNGFARLETPDAFLVLRQPLQTYDGAISKQLGARAIRLRMPHVPGQQLGQTPPIYLKPIDPGFGTAVFRAFLDPAYTHEYVWEGELQGFDGNWTPTTFTFVYITNGDYLSAPGILAQVNVLVARAFSDPTISQWQFDGRPHCITDVSAAPDKHLKNATVNLHQSALQTPTVSVNISVPIVVPTLQYFVASLPQVRNTAVGDLAKGAFELLKDNVGQAAQGFANAIELPGLPKIPLGGIAPPDSIMGLVKGLPSIGQLALEYGPIFGQLQDDSTLAAAFIDNVHMFGADITPEVQALVIEAVKQERGAAPRAREWVEQQVQGAVHRAEVAIQTCSLPQDYNLPQLPLLDLTILKGAVLDLSVQILLAIDDRPQISRKVSYRIHNALSAPVFRVDLSGWVTFEFKEITITCELGQSPQVSAPMSGVTLGNNIRALAEAVKSVTDGIMPTMRYALDYLYSDLTIQYPGINSGAFSLRNFSLSFSVGLPIGDQLPKCGFTIGTRVKPLALAVGIYTGHAFFAYMSPVDLQFELEFGVSAAFDFLDIASGMVDVAVGFYVALQESQDPHIDLHLRATGHLSVCGVVSIDVLFYFAFEADGTHYFGEGEVDVDIDILFVISISVQLKMRREFNSGQSRLAGARPASITPDPPPNYADFMTQDDWSEYCASF